MNKTAKFHEKWPGRIQNFCPFVWFLIHKRNKKVKPTLAPTAVLWQPFGVERQMRAYALSAHLETRNVAVHISKAYTHNEPNCVSW